MKDQNEKQSGKRRVPQNARAKEDVSVVDSADELTTMYTVKSEDEPEFPDEWIAIAAYYIWKNDRHPEGHDAEY